MWQALTTGSAYGRNRMAFGRRPSGHELPALELETWSEPAAPGVASERPGMGVAGWLVVAGGLVALLGFLLFPRGASQQDAAPDAPSPAVRAPEPDRGPSVAIVAQPEQFVARTATLMPPGRYPTVPLSSDELLSSVRTLVEPGQVELTLGRYSELQRGTVTIDHLAWVLVEKDVAVGSLGPEEVSGSYRLTNRVRVFDAITGDAL